MKIYDRLKKVREDNKGFTLVELIVVLVILAILAAILVPALLGYIDRAKESQYELEAKAVLTAMQGEASRKYAHAAAGSTLSFDADDIVLIQDTADVSGLTITAITPQTPATSASDTQKLHAAYTIVGCDITFTSANGNTVQCVLSETTKSWTCTVKSGTATE